MLAPALLALAAFAVAPASAHIKMVSPAPWRSPDNPNTVEADKDYSYTAPLDASGSNFPCKGYHAVLGTDAGKSVANWAAGSSQSFQLGGTATHGGGSCQASLSYDGGHTFKVIKTFHGGCPLNQNLNFDIPDDAPSGEAVFAWTWFNRLGNREMYMNCATVTIGGGGNGRRRRSGVSLAGAPDIFVANVGNGCTTIEGADVTFPNPGPNVETGGDGKFNQPGGSCASGGSGSGSGSGSQSSSAEPSPSAAPSASSSSVEETWTNTTAVPEWTESTASASASSTTSFDNGQWHPSSSAEASASTGKWDQWHNNGSSSSASASASSSPVESPSAAPSPSTTKKCNRKRRVRRHKKRSAHGQVSSF